MKPFKIPMLFTSLFVLFSFPGIAPPPLYADFDFGEPVPILPVLDPENHYEFINCLSYDGLELYFHSLRPGGEGDYDLWVLKRISVDEDWGPPENLGPVVNGPTEEGSPFISRDGLELYFHSNRTGGYAIYMTTRHSKDAPWQSPVNLGSTVNSPFRDAAQPWISSNGLELYFGSSRPGGYGRGDIYVSTRATTEDPWDEAVNVGPAVNSPYDELFLSLSPDGLLLLFGETSAAPWHPGGYGEADVWISRRASLSDPWQGRVNAGPNVNGPERENIPRISPDGRTLYFISRQTGEWQNYQAPILPIVDFNGDEAVDAADIDILIDCWGTDEPLCDIGPYAWGDGVVDVEDLIVLVEHIVAARADAEDSDAGE